MKQNYIIIIVFALLGFLFSAFPSLIAGVSVKLFFLRILISTSVMSLFGFGIYYFVEKSENSGSGEQRQTYGQNEEEEDNDRQDEIYGEKSGIADILKKSREETIDLGGDENTAVDEGDEDQINYSSLFSPGENEKEDQPEPVKEDNYESLNDAKLENSFKNENPDKKNQVARNGLTEDDNSLNTDLLSKLEEDVASINKNKVEINPNQKVAQMSDVNYDKDFNSSQMNDDEKILVHSTSSDNIVHTDIESIDKEYIYLRNEKKIENKPEKLAKVIKGMIMNEEEK